jgi:predicted transcriptional regulator
MRINGQSVYEAEKLIEQLLTVIETYGITQKSVFSKANMTKNTWRAKIRNKSFTIVELKQIVEAINK